MIRQHLMYCYVYILTAWLICNSCNGHVASLPDCSSENMSRTESLIFVSTLDGFVTALNASDNGSVLWTFKTGNETMLSSTIQYEELTNNGMWIRMIPSLSGSLYRYDGKYVEVVPVSVEELLTSSFRYSDNLIFSGIKKTVTFGVNVRTGRLVYECSLNGCRNFTREDKGDDSERTNDDTEELLIVQKYVQTVRAVVPSTGFERWNFSVAEHDLKITRTVQCHEKDPSHLDLNIFAVVPEAMVYATKKRRPDVYIWKAQLNSPIVNMWKWQNGELRPVEMFSRSQWTWNVPNVVVEPVGSPSIYIGMYDGQLYVHESVSMKKLVDVYVDRFDRNTLAAKGLRISVPRIPWKLFPASSDAVAIADAKETVAVRDDTELSKFLPTSLSEYIDGSGYYLYAESRIDDSDNVTIGLDSTEDETNVHIVIISLWFWWKEVTIISVTIAVIVNLSCFRRNAGAGEPHERNSSVRDRSESNGLSPERPERNDLKSRFTNEFDLVATLGRGGFGTVFEVKNKIDNCRYAVKRIRLPKCDESRERVMREVRALATLDHHNIVRYFNAWVESHPSDRHRNIHSKLRRGAPVSFSRETLSKSSSFEASGRIRSTRSFEEESCVKSRESTRNDSGDDDSFVVFEKGSVFNDGHGSDDTDLNTESPNARKSLRVSDRMKSEPATQMFLYIQMQLCERESLREWINRHLKREKEQVRVIFEQIVRAVEYVHLRGLIHRDLKPSNILFSLDGKIKVGDFGLVTDRADEETFDSSRDKFSVTENNSKHTLDVGTQLYMSPEQLKRNSYNYKVDIYSLGVIYFELLNPFSTEMERIQTLKCLRNLKFPDKFRETFADEHALLRLMLSRNPEERPTTIGIRARPPFSHRIEEDKWHFDLPCKKL